MKGCTSFPILFLPPSFLPHSSTQENSSLTTQVASLKQSLQESQEQASRIRSELHKVKGAAKSPVGDGRVSELEGRLRIVEEESMSLQVHIYTCTCIYMSVCNSALHLLYVYKYNVVPTCAISCNSM